MRILYTGGGTLGSVSPLIAIHQKLKNKIMGYNCLWIGTHSGPEKDVVSKENIPFKSIIAGKLRRYFDLRNIVDIFKILIGSWQALYYILKFKPEVILSAGGFVAVPVVWAGKLLGVPSIIHQQDVCVGLANKLMAPAATRITVALEKSLNDFSKKKVVLVGNPVRQNPKFKIQNPKQIQNSKFKFEKELPVVLVMGGGTGALAINKLIWESLDELTKFCNIIHITGKNKNNYQLPITNYQLQYKSFEFLGDDIFDVIQSADVVVSRAGMSTLTELAYFKKPCIIIPLSHSHQIKNAEYFASQNACVYLKQEELNKIKFIKQVKQVLENKDLQKKLAENAHNIFIDYSGEKIINLISTRFPACRTGR